MAGLRMPHGYAARPAAVDDAAAIAAVIAAHEQDTDGQVEIETWEVEADLRRPSLDLANDTVLVLDPAGGVVATGELYAGRRADCTVIPEARGRGLGSALLAWTQARAVELGSDQVGQTVSDAAEPAIALFQRHGYRPRWTSWILTVDLAAIDIAPPRLPDGYAIRDARLGTDDREVHRVIEDAFDEWPDRVPTSFEDWSASVLSPEGFAPWQLPVVEHAGRVVGTAALIRYDTGGWVHQLAVDRAHRGRGLGRALLEHAFAVFAAHGDRVAELNTDTRTGALGLYEHVGMTVRRSYRHWATSLGAH